MRPVRCKGRLLLLALQLSLVAVIAASPESGALAGVQHAANALPTSATAAQAAQATVTARAATPTFPVKGIYVNAGVARSPRMRQLVRLVEETELNAMVLDVNSGVSLLNQSRGNGRLTRSQSAGARQLRQLVRELKQKRIYLIARIVTFKNSPLAEANPAWAIRRTDGSVWKDDKGAAWIDPYCREAWEYPIALAIEAARIGFDEVQFDYVRFPENAAKLNREAAWRNREGWSKQEVVRRFLHTATKRAHRAGVVVSADVFGLVGSSRSDMGIGQTWPAIAPEVDVISPMMYPSHYGPGIWGVPHPDLAPSSIVTRALQDALRQNRALRDRGRHTPEVRPWLQSFTATWIHPHQRYGEAQIRQQVEAAARLGVTSYLLWNSSGRYPLG